MRNKDDRVSILFTAFMISRLHSGPVRALLTSVHIKFYLSGHQHQHHTQITAFLASHPHLFKWVSMKGKERFKEIWGAKSEGVFYFRRNFTRLMFPFHFLPIS